MIFFLALYAREYTDTQLARMRGMQSGFAPENSFMPEYAPYFIGGAFVLFFLLVFLMAVRHNPKKLKGLKPVEDDLEY